MKKIFLVLSFITLNVLTAQESTAFSNIDIGFYGGINFYNTNNIRGDFLVEIKTDLIPSLKLKASAGYFRTIQPKSYTVRQYSENTIDTIPRFFASKFNLVSKNYNVFPVSFGIQYNFYQNLFSPYLTIDAVYNFINTSIDTSPPEVWSYNSIDEIPPEFKVGQQVEEDYPNNSYGIMLGVGTSYQISSNLNLDFRYLFKYDNQIINTHHLIAGIYF